MTSGLDWIEGHGAEYLDRRRNWAVAMLSRPMDAEPGRRFNYSSANAHLLSVAITRATHEPTVAFANENLFGPLGFTLPLLEWSTDVQGIYSGGAGLRLRARDMAKLGYLYLNDGCWNGVQIVSAKWVAESVRKWSDPGNGSAGFGFFWWLSSVVPGAYAAVGAGGQYSLRGSHARCGDRDRRRPHAGMAVISRF